MMTVTKVHPKQKDYFKLELKAELEPLAIGSPKGPGYWQENPELEGVWLGKGAEALGLSGAVDELGFARLFGCGTDPLTGAALGRGWSPDSNTVVAGYALTFSPPKSVSVLWAAGDDAVAGQVEAAHVEAVAASLTYLEEHAGFTRRGRAGVLQIDTQGYVAAAFTHRTSRAADPQLHTHVLVANKVRAVTDGKWLALDGTEIYRTQKAAGMLYKAALRAELTARLGLSWSVVDANGVAEIQGVPAALAEAWSKRREQVLSLAKRMTADREAAVGRTLSAGERARVHELAALQSRAPKVGAETPTAELRARWRSEAIAFGYDPAIWLGKTVEVVPVGRTPKRVRSGFDIGLAISTLTESHASWGRAEATELLAVQAGGNHFADADTARAGIERAVDRLLRHEEVLRLAAPLPAPVPASLRRDDGMSAVEHHGAVRYTTKTTLAREARLLELAASGINAGVAVIPMGTVADVLADSGLGLDQQFAVGDLLTGGERVACLVGPAGAGKSRSLSVARQGWQARGYEVIGLAPSARAAAVLSEEAGIGADTLAKFLHADSALNDRSVVVVDEASMASTANLAALAERIDAAGAKLVLVGDDHQLGAVGSGGLFATLVADHGAAELSTIRRFEAAWERAASLRLRVGDAAILPAYVRHGRVLGAEREAVLDAAFDAWSKARDAGRSVLVMTPDNGSVDVLALRCRAALVASGEVSPETVPAGRQVVGVGDEVISLRNERRLVTETGEWVRNGSRWRIESMGPDGAVLSSLEGHGSVRVPGTYVADDLSLAYATTIHKGQGVTVDEGIVIVEPSMTAESLYVGMTRGRFANRAMVVTEVGGSDHVRAQSVEPVEVLARVMTHVGTGSSAHRVMRTELSRFDNQGLLRELIEEHARHVDALAGPDRSQAIKALLPRADVGAATVHLMGEEAAAREATLRRELAEKQLLDPADTSLRTRLPGRLGEQARRREHEVVLSARSEVDLARRAERSALSAVSVARHRLFEAEKAKEALEPIRVAQGRRIAWLHTHPGEVGWAQGLRERLSTLEREATIRELRVRRERGLDRRGTKQRKLDISGPRLPGLDGGAEAAERRRERAVRNRGMGRNGPSLGL